MAEVTSVLVASKKVFIKLDLDVDYPTPKFGEMIIAMEKRAYEKLNGGLELGSECDIKIMTKREVVKKAILDLSEERRKECTKYLKGLGMIWDMPYEAMPYEAHRIRVFADRKRIWYDAKMSWWSMAEDLKT